MKTSISIIGIIFLVVLLKTPNACTTTKKSKPCKECPEFTQQIDSLKKKIQIDSVTIKIIETDLDELWAENQLFSSMLSEIENEPGGHEILKTLYQNNS
jgi:hypothetical protein